MIKPEFLDIDLFIKDKSVLRLFQAVKDYGGVMRFVGGAVRDAIAGLKGFEFDLATDLSPEELVEACFEAGLKTVPIGLKFATTGVIVNNKIFEVSSLYKSDKSSNIDFTDDWNADASRRDLSINAIYADDKGNVFDYYNGLNDLENGIIRFIGDPFEQIKAHPIRIMRFFRFYAIFGQGEPDKKSLNACTVSKDLLKTVAIEQIRDELFKIFAVANPVSTLEYIFKNDILGFILPQPSNFSPLVKLSEIVEQNNQLPDALRRLFILYQPDEELAENLAVRLHLNKNQKKRLISWAKFDLDTNLIDDDSYLAKQVYLYGRDFCKDKILFMAALLQYDEAKYFDKICQIDSLVIPEFPVTGADIVKLGSMDQSKIGECLSVLKNYWLNHDFKPSKDELCAQALDFEQLKAI